MKILIILLIFSLSLGTYFLVDSKAQISEKIAPTSHPSLSQIVLQIEVRNSDGVLVFYQEPSKYFLRNIDLIHDFLDNKSKRSIVTINGEKYEQIEWKTKTYTSSSWDQQSGYGLGWQGFEILHARLNGSISQEGDIVTAHWKVYRPI